MRILMVNKYLYPRAGAETYMLYVSKQLVDAGHEVAFFGMTHPENTRLGRCETFDFLEFGIRQTFTDKLNSIAKAASLTVFGKMQNGLNKIIKEFKPDIIHAHNIYNQLSPSLFTRYINEIPVIMTIHDFKPICPNYSLFTKGTTCSRCLHGNYYNCIKYSCIHESLLASTLAVISSYWHRLRGTYKKGYTQYIAPSSFLHSKMIDGGIPADKIRVLNNFAILPAEFSPPGQGILYAGRLCKEKGIDVLLEAYSRLAPPRPKLTVAGTGPLENELKAMATAKGLNEIEWLGRIPPEEVENRLEKCAVSVIPSTWYENCSMAIMESLAHGRPCIVSDSGGNPELIENEKTGWVFHAGDVDSLKINLDFFIKTPIDLLQKMGENAHSIACVRFSSQVHMEKLYEIYDRLCKQEEK